MCHFSLVSNALKSFEPMICTLTALVNCEFYHFIKCFLPSLQYKGIKRPIPSGIPLMTSVLQEERSLVTPNYSEYMEKGTK